MDVIFATKSDKQNRFTIGNTNCGRLYFKKGSFSTTDKEQIKFLLSHPLKKRGEYVLVSNPELVAKYLDGQQAETLTEEILNNVTRQGILELKALFDVTSTQPSLIKLELVGQPITDPVQKILDFYIVANEIQDEIVEAQTTRKAKVIKSEEN
jgi:hypothetical protein